MKKPIKKEKPRLKELAKALKEMANIQEPVILNINGKLSFGW
jgi:hypothetical protein